MEPATITSYSYYTGTQWVEDEKEVIPPACALKWGTHRTLTVPDSDTVIGYTYATCLPIGHGTNEIKTLPGPNPEINVYPNPVTDWMVVNSSQSIESIEVIDIMGRIVHSSDYFNVTETRLDMSYHTRGIYILRCTFDNGAQKSIKILK